VAQLLAQKGDERPLTDADSLFLSGRLQSIDAVEIVIFVEDRWGVDFSQVGFDESMIDSIGAIEALVEREGKVKK